MKIKWKQLIACIIIPLLVGGVSALLSGGMSDFENVIKPPLSPPGWLFPVVWTILYILMGIASYLVLQSNFVYRKKSALSVYALQLFFNFFWSIIFFGFELYWFAFIWLVILYVLIIINAVLFYNINRAAGWLLIPYLLWVTFAGYLNFAIALLN